MSRCGSLPDPLKSFPEMLLLPLDASDMDLEELDKQLSSKPQEGPIGGTLSDSDSAYTSPSTSPAINATTPSVSPSLPALVPTLASPGRPPVEASPLLLPVRASSFSSSSGYSPPDSPTTFTSKGKRRKQAPRPVQPPPNTISTVAATAAVVVGGVVATRKPKLTLCSSSSSSSSDHSDRSDLEEDATTTTTHTTPVSSVSSISTISTTSTTTTATLSRPNASSCNVSTVSTASTTSASSTTSMNRARGKQVSPQSKAKKEVVKEGDDNESSWQNKASSRPRRSTVRPVVYKDAPDLSYIVNEEEDEQEEEEEDERVTVGGKRRKGAGGGEVRGKRERNKLSAANYRKRRKVYIDGLEANMAKLSKKNKGLEEQNRQLQARLATLEQQLLQQAQNSSSTSTSQSNSNMENQKKRKSSAASAAAGGGLVMFALLTCILVFLPALLGGNGKAAGLFTRSDINQYHRDELPSSFSFDMPSRSHTGRSLLHYCPVTPQDSDDSGLPAFTLGNKGADNHGDCVWSEQST
eukprot:gb/GEZN01004899.1/.p1 GENE.gb/GEZN01004899.1/~~gb/GEZN01004899.1/.p1  ORF type:complete len:605 (+),score=136.00 gb/GEZN01004899.1/:246-1817(+)